jgi:hypothetical protein
LLLIIKIFSPLRLVLARESELLEAVPSVVTPEMNSFLRKPFCRDEIKLTLNSMGDLKAPGPDGMPAIFYK